MTVLNNELLIDAIGDEIALNGFAVIADTFPADLTEALLNQLMALDPDGFKLAGIGRENDFQTDKSIRSDRILWLDEDLLETQQYFTWVEQLRLALNKRFFLGLFEYECMFAHYPEGAFYQKHVDAFKTGSNRKISSVLYLNKDWQNGDGGELLLYHEGDEAPFMKVSPKYGTLVVFLSEDFPHEVLPAKRSRYSLTGWFRVNTPADVL
ncbi:2OG-Fe(II) oxygenase [Marinicella litoralis]|uniref:SM-20-related protein n=1 Tax=Marinicella litoralis TaxID=644220 RepID=A0A4R6XRW1_9GAMM|nr:2OG-Fe(II) oxygenase [Marinicella litoralis]TDR20754.1 SM-20-related protein [Marinicella litoralis]